MAKANSTTALKPWKHNKSGLWCITRKGKRYYLGKTESEAKHRAKRYEKSIERGLKIPELGTDRVEDFETEPTVRNVLLQFLAAQKKRVESRELSTRSLRDYATSCREFTAFVGDEMWVTDLRPTHFMEYREEVSKRRNLIGVGNEVTRIKTAFKWCYDYDAIDLPVKFGPEFRRPRKSDVKRFKRSQEKQAFTAEEVRLLLTELGVHYRAMALLGINGGFGNSDCSDLLLSEVDFDKNEIVAIRKKTANDRVVTLWPETVDALKLSIACRPEPKTEAAKNKFFVTPEGDIFVKDEADNKNQSNSITQRTTGALQRLKIHTPGKTFYWLRHTFRSVADELPDQAAIGLIMGHADDRTASNYVHSLPRKRIKVVTDHVRNWLFGEVIE